MTCENKLKSSDSNSRWGNLLSSLPSSLPPPPPYHPGFLSLFLLPTCDHRLSRLPPLLATCTLSSESEHPVLWQRLHQAGLFAPILRADLRQGPVKRRRTQSQEALAQLLAIPTKTFPKSSSLALLSLSLSRAESGVRGEMREIGAGRKELEHVGCPRHLRWLLEPQSCRSRDFSSKVVLKGPPASQRCGQGPYCTASLMGLYSAPTP